MLARFGAIVTETVDVVEAHHVVVLLLFIFCLGAAADFRVEVVAVLVLDLQQPAHVVDAGDQLLAPFKLVLHAQRLEQASGTDLDRVAQSDRLDAGMPEHVAGQHRHRVGVVDQEGVGADFLDVAGEIGHDRDGAQRPHDAADPERVGDRLAQAVLFRDFKVDDRAGVVAADLDGVDDEGRAAQGIPAVFDPEITLDPRSPLVDVVVDDGQHHLRLLEPVCVDVVQADLAVAERFGRHAVAQDIFGKNGAAGAHKGNLDHVRSSRILLMDGQNGTSSRNFGSIPVYHTGVMATARSAAMAAACFVV